MGHQRRHHSEDGFTVVEVVIAAAIMFFVLTAIIGLMGASSSLTVMAKQRAVMTNSVAAYLENLRVLPWDEVVQPSGPVRMTINGVDIVINVSVETRTEEGQEIIKVIRVAAVSTVDGKSQMYETSVALLKNPNFNRTLRTDPDAPVVYFMPEAPEDDAVIWGNQSASGPLMFRTKAFSPVDKIAKVQYDITGRTAPDSFAVFTVSPGMQTYYSAPSIDTLSEGIGDGFQTVSVAATDEHERTGTMKRRYIIDNVAPQSPGPSTITSITSALLNLQWNAAVDGGTVGSPNYASHYAIQMSVEPSQTQPLTANDRVVLNDPNWLADNNVALAVAGPGIVATDVVVADEALPVTQRAVPPFSRFTVRIMSRSPRGLTNNAWVPSVQPGYTRPELFCEPAPSLYSSVCTVTTTSNTATYRVRLLVSQPGFRWTGTRTWQIEFQSQTPTPTPQGWQVFAGGTSGVSITSQEVDPYAMVLEAVRPFSKPSEFSDGRRVYFRVRVDGYRAQRDGAIVPVLRTNAAGPSGAPGVRTPLARVWDF